MKKNLYLILFCALCSCGSKINLINQKLTYNDDAENFEMIFVNDSILKVYPKKGLTGFDVLTYKYSVLDKEKLITIKENQPSVNFKTTVKRNCNITRIISKLIDNEKTYSYLPFKEIDTLYLLKLGKDKKLYFHNGNKVIEIN